MKISFFIFNILIVMFLFSCANEKPQEQEENNSALIEVSNNQFLSEGMLLGKPVRVPISLKTDFTGKVVPKLSDIAVLSAPLEGIVQQVFVQTGEYLKVNEAVLRIGGNALIDLQQQFASSSARLKQLESNYERAKTLYEENIKTSNEFERIESDFKSEQAKFSALKLKLQYIGVDTEKVSQGNYASSYLIKSPIEGQLDRINVLQGSFIGSDDELAVVMNSSEMQLELTFFDDDFSSIETGQKVHFRALADDAPLAKAVILRKLDKVDPSSNTFHAFAKINPAFLSSFAANQIVKGEVLLSTDTVAALPRQAVFSSNSQHYVLVLTDQDENKWYFDRLPVQTGKFNETYIELINFPEDRQVLIEGAFNIGLE